MLSSPCSLYAIVRDGFLPAMFARIDPTYRTPAAAIWTHAALELARRDVRAGAPPFAPPGAWLGPVAGGALVLWILSTATPAEFALTAIVLAVAALAFVVRKRTRSILL